MKRLSKYEAKNTLRDLRFEISRAARISPDDLAKRFANWRTRQGIEERGAVLAELICEIQWLERFANNYRLRIRNELSK